MLNCDWASKLTRYDCRQVKDLHGQDALEIGTPFSLHDGTAISLYVVTHGSHVLISDNGDTLYKLHISGLDVWARLRAVRDRIEPYGVTLAPSGDLRCLAHPDHAPFLFARAVSCILAVNDWAAGQLRIEPHEQDLAAEAEPYIVARDPALPFERRKLVTGASRTEYRFDMRHGTDLIDVIAPSPQATGGVMRKVGDVQNGPFAAGLSPLIVVDDRQDGARATQEISIIGSITRAMPFSRLQGMRLH